MFVIYQKIKKNKPILIRFIYVLWLNTIDVDLDHFYSGWKNKNFPIVAGFLALRYTCAYQLTRLGHGSQGFGSFVSVNSQYTCISATSTSEILKLENFSNEIKRFF